MALAQSNKLTQSMLAQMQAQAQNNYAAGIGGLLNAGIGGAYQTTGNVSSNVTNVTTSITASTGSNTVYISANGHGYQSPAQTVSAPAAKVPDEFQWLRKRVDDVCWRQAA